MMGYVGQGYDERCPAEVGHERRTRARAAWTSDSASGFQSPLMQKALKVRRFGSAHLKRLRRGGTASSALKFDSQQYAAICRAIVANHLQAPTPVCFQPERHPRLILDARHVLSCVLSRKRHATILFLLALSWSHRSTHLSSRRCLLSQRSNAGRCWEVIQILILLPHRSPL